MLGVVFRVGKQRCVIPASEINEALPHVRVSEGGIIWRGRRLQLLDLSLLLREEPSPQLRSTRVLVCGDIALLAPSATDAISIDKQLPPPDIAPPFVRAIVDTGGEPAWLLDVAMLREARHDA